MTYNVPIPSLLAPNKITQYYNLYNNPIKNFTFFHYIQSIKQEKNKFFDGSKIINVNDPEIINHIFIKKSDIYLKDNYK